MKTALITGASGGIGSAIARKLRADGCRLLIAYRSNERSAARLAEELDGEFVRMELSTEEGIDAAADFVGSRAIDILINNAGESPFGMLSETKPETIRSALRTNLESAVMLSRAASFHMMKTGFGRIVQISSVYGISGSACETVYSAAKAGLIGFTKALAKELGRGGVTVNAVAPGAIDTPMNARLDERERIAVAREIPIGRFGTPEEVAEVVSFLTSERAAYVTGEVVGVSGGWL